MVDGNSMEEHRLKKCKSEGPVQKPPTDDEIVNQLNLIMGKIRETPPQNKQSLVKTGQSSPKAKNEVKLDSQEPKRLSVLLNSPDKKQKQNPAESGSALHGRQNSTVFSLGEILSP